MKELESIFKNREEIEKFFGDEVFRFKFMSEGTMYFETLNPIFISDQLVRFQLAFYYENGLDFFGYSSFKSWLDNFQLSEVSCINEESLVLTKMYFEEYKGNEAD